MKQEIESIKERNKRVEADKAWETSKTRRGIIAILTYLTMVLLLYLIKAPNPWVNALIPAVAFILSTLSLSFVKKWWVIHVYNK
ncbi:hypothetical protein HYV81_00850 [Candidatus Woesearchaeota archaeon]|nr:hypothetical protein [Candidatus Woesearchaeota archaeon]